jgi:tetratricopeptide (TPR) repeat protein
VGRAPDNVAWRAATVRVDAQRVLALQERATSDDLLDPAPAAQAARDAAVEAAESLRRDATEHMAVVRQLADVYALCAAACSKEQAELRTSLEARSRECLASVAAREPPNGPTRLRLYQETSAAAQRSPEPRQALELRWAAVAVARGICPPSVPPGDPARSVLGEALTATVDAQLAVGDPLAAEGPARETLELSEEDVGVAVRRRDALQRLGAAQQKMARVLGAQERFDEAIAHANRAREITTEILRQHPADALARYSEAAILSEIQDLERKAGRLDAALAHASERRGILHGLVEEFPLASAYRASLIKAHGEIAAILEKQRDLEGAVRELTAALGVIDEAARRGYASPANASEIRQRVLILQLQSGARVPQSAAEHVWAARGRVARNELGSAVSAYRTALSDPRFREDAAGLFFEAARAAARAATVPGEGDPDSLVDIALEWVDTALSQRLAALARAEQGPSNEGTQEAREEIRDLVTRVRRSEPDFASLRGSRLDTVLERVPAWARSP